MIYRYIAVAPSGSVIDTRAEFANVDELREHVKAQGLELIEANADLLRTWFRVTRAPKVSEPALVDVFEYLAGLMGMGMDVATAVQTVGDSLDDKQVIKGLRQISEQLAKGYPLSGAMAETRMFPQLALASIEAGEISGQLERVFKELATHYREQHALKTAAKKAAMYPVISLMVLMTITVLILVFVVPQLADIFPKDPPLPTRLMLLASSLIRDVWWLIPPAIPILWLTWKRIPAPMKTAVWQRVYRLPLVGAMVKQLALANLFMNLGMLMSGGVAMVEALRLVAKGTTSRVMHFKLRQVHEMVLTGASLGEAFSDPFFPPMVAKAIRQGENTGRLDEYCNRIATFLKDRFHTRVTMLSTFIEPAIIVLGGGLVLMLAMAIFLPVYQQLEGLRR